MNTEPNIPQPPCSSPSPTQNRVIPTGSIALDRALGTGGWPRGRIVEIFGSEGCGKTTLCFEAIASAQRNSGVAAIIDADHGSTPEALARIGVDPHGVVIQHTNTFEEVFKSIREFIKRNMDMIVLDSIAAVLRDRAEYADSPKDQTHQKMLEHELKLLLNPLSRSRSVLLITNQLREKLGVMYGDPNMTPWETHPLKDFASIRLELKRITHVKDGENIIGSEHRVRVVKNRLAAPFQNAEFNMLFATGIDEEAELLKLGLELDALTKSGKHIRFGNVSLGPQEYHALNLLRRDANLTAELREAVQARLGDEFAAEPWPAPMPITEGEDTPEGEQVG